MDRVLVGLGLDGFGYTNGKLKGWVLTILLTKDTAHPQHATKGLESTSLASLPVLIFCQDEFKERLECEICLSELAERRES
ncbi:hypothetical protein J1N35_013280 [Gossypium stocksii]|uniref:Uncharacterized protein n=1 Tax=Gossypium stocksii TaxID=47602 RepID=A0A9D3VUI7_9ROSI|nr:hypothetical protein J1N35_013280 [Gossypium stocksii]